VDLTTVGRWLVAAGVALAAVGGVLWLLGRAGVPLGRLPGDVSLEGRGWSLHVPLVTMLLVSVVLTLVANVLLRLFRR